MFLKTSIYLLLMTDYLHTKFGLIWIKESYGVTEGERNPPPPPKVENVLNRPGEIGLSPSLFARLFNLLKLTSLSFLTSTYSKTIIILFSLDTYENEAKKEKIHILFYNLCHYTDTIIESMDFLFLFLLFLLLSFLLCQM